MLFLIDSIHRYRVLVCIRFGIDIDTETELKKNVSFFGISRKQIRGIALITYRNNYNQLTFCWQTEVTYQFINFN